MREIKFRVEYRKKVYEVEGINFVHRLIFVDGKGVPLSLSDVNLLQFTGLKDKNGKEIYEGDVVSYKDGRIVQVTWHDYTARFDSVGITNKGTPHPLTNRPDILAEVIGNIYENPELFT